MFDFDFTEMIKEAMAKKEEKKQISKYDFTEQIKEAMAKRQPKKNNKVILTLADEFKQKEMNITVSANI